MTTRILFATRLYEAPLGGGEGLNADLLDACRMLADEDKAGQAWSKDHGYRGYTSYASLDDLPRRATAFAQLKTRLDRHAKAFAKELHLDLAGRRLVFDSLWVNVLKPGGAHSGHIHPNSVLSGTCYVAMPRGAPALKLEDPRLPMMMAAPPRTAEAPEDARTFVYAPAEPGTVLMWESWLRHEVPANAARADRVSISFNYAWR